MVILYIKIKILTDFMIYLYRVTTQNKYLAQKVQLYIAIRSKWATTQIETPVSPLFV